MSRSYEYSYALEAEARQAMYNARVSATTERFYQKYMDQYHEMQTKGYAAYIPDEMNRLKSDLAQIRNLLTEDPREARDLSFEVGSYIRSMSSLASAAIRQFETSERIRVGMIREEKTQRKNELMQLYFELLKEISNPIVANFSVDELQTLRSDIESGKVTDKTTVKNTVMRITASAKTKAAEWKKKTVSENRKKNVDEQLAETEERLKTERIENQEKTKEFVEKIQQLRQKMNSSSTDYVAVEAEISKIESDVDDTLITEEVRRETVKAIIKQLRSQDFTVEKPQINNTDGKNYVKIIARRPSGKRAVCSVDLHGKIAYKFDNYEGMTCLKDIEKFNVDLEQIYSIKLSDERVLWSNPDRLSRDVESMPRNKGGNANGC